MPPKKNALYARAENMNIDDIVKMLEHQDALTESLKKVGKYKEVDHSKICIHISRFSPKEYKGTGAPILLDNWHREMENILELVHCPDELKVEQAAFYLREVAGEWWDKVKVNAREMYARHGLPAIPWDEFRKAMRREFVPEHVRSKLREEFDEFKMPSDMTV